MIGTVVNFSPCTYQDKGANPSQPIGKAPLWPEDYRFPPEKLATTFSVSIAAFSFLPPFEVPT